MQPDAPLRARALQTVRVVIADAAGRPVDGATIEIGGGMPEHGHGLPTRRASRGRSARAALGKSELEPLHLTARERRQLESFLGALSAETR